MMRFGSVLGEGEVIGTCRPIKYQMEKHRFNGSDVECPYGVSRGEKEKVRRRRSVHSGFRPPPGGAGIAGTEAVTYSTKYFYILLTI
jgi:hypothetical protein